MVLLLIKNMLDTQESHPAVNDPGLLRKIRGICRVHEGS
jgi:hypothetical protein